ncbi:NBS-LRR type resistance protein [Cucumis melo var. makuwa]|uniref:NBS-LRR type resistance protein n=1 Tax=Cucumis melo var. makuwa TaxID=1194695 RepID=A0A5A7UV06_CUCMM|nr:NBS-LRR type resistance protein [Cucumis melo var. makuwa]
MAFTRPSYLSSFSGSVERTYQSSAPEGCTHQSSAPEGCTHQSSAPEGCTHQSSAPEGCTHQSSAPEGCTHQSSAPEGCTYPGFRVGSAWNRGELNGNFGVRRRGESRLGGIRQLVLLSRGGGRRLDGGGRFEAERRSEMDGRGGCSISETETTTEGER